MAGHIDHGKTALIRALTGIETDRLPEEKQRGITIDIGFAYWKDNVTIIDVPGHEKFIRNMVAGVSTVDMFLLVIAADDGIMPQTREHLDILKFFGVKDGVVALNKTDLVEKEWAELVRQEIEMYLVQNGFTNIPVIPVSATTGSGIEEFSRMIELKINQIHQRPATRPFRLAIDRSFTTKGFGAVVTGTVLSSSVSAGEEIVLLPDNKTGRVRGIEVHQKTVSQAIAGQRAALNLVNLPLEELTRGKVLVKPDSLVVANELFASIQTIKNLKFRIRRNNNFHIHIGTDERLGRVDWFEADNTLDSGRAYHVRIRFSQPVVAAPGDAILLRSFSPVTTVGGGTVLQINPPKLRRTRDNWMNYFDTLKSGGLQDRIRLYLEHKGYNTCTLTELQQFLFETEQTVSRELNGMLADSTITEVSTASGRNFLVRNLLDDARQKVTRQLQNSMKIAGYTRGLNRQELQNLLKIGEMSGLFLDELLREAVRQKQIIFDGELYKLPADSGSNKNQAARDQIIKYYLSAGFSAPDLSQLSQYFKMDVKTARELTAELAKKNLLRSINGQFYLHEDMFQKLLTFLRSHFSTAASIDLAGLKSYTDTTRKWLIPLMEYLDQKGFTKRNGDLRIKGENL